MEIMLQILILNVFLFLLIPSLVMHGLTIPCTCVMNLQRL